MNLLNILKAILNFSSSKFSFILYWFSTSYIDMNNFDLGYLLLSLPDNRFILNFSLQSFKNNSISSGVNNLAS